MIFVVRKNLEKEKEKDGTYKLYRKKDEQNVSGNKETELHGSPFSVSKNVDS